MSKNDKKLLSRRDFLKTLGAGAVVTSAALADCKSAVRRDRTHVTGEVPADKMTYRINPHSGDRVSLLGYGCMRWPLRPRPDGQGDEIDQDAVNELVDYAIAHGVNYFDTSPAYVRGWSETATGIALSRHPRDRYFIATKMSNFATQTWNRASSLEIYRRSMENLQADYFDYYLLHGIGMDGMNAFEGRFIENGILDFLLEERAAGRIRNLGFSYHGDIAVFDRLLSMDIQWDFAQIQHNYVDWQHASGRNTDSEYLYGELVKRNVPAVVMEPLLGGRLARLNSVSQEPLRRLRPEDSPAAWAFRYAGSQEHILTVLSGMVYMDHLQENIRTYSPLAPLTPEEYDALEQVTRIMLDEDFIPCTECQYCMPCPYGIDIPAIFAHYNKVVNERRLPDDRTDPEYRKNRRRFLIGQDREVPVLRQANHCIGCGICKGECPQRIPIPDQMQRIDRFVEELKTDPTFANGW